MDEHTNNIHLGKMLTQQKFTHQLVPSAGNGTEHHPKHYDTEAGYCVVTAAVVVAAGARLIGNDVCWAMHFARADEHHQHRKPFQGTLDVAEDSSQGYGQSHQNTVSKRIKKLQF